MRSIHCWMSSRYFGWLVITITALLLSSGMKRNMPAVGDLPCSPNTRSRSCTTSLARPDCSGYTPTDMLAIQSTSNTWMVRR